MKEHMMNDTIDRPPAIETPAGMMRNVSGGFTPISIIRPHVLLEDQLVGDLVARAHKLRDAIAEFKAASFSDVQEFIELLAWKYGAKRGGERGNMTLESFDGLRRVQVATADFMTFGPELQVAKNLVDECLEKWTQESGDELRAIVNDAFDVGKEGKIRVDRILGLRRLKIEDATWLRAMEAIGDAIRVTRSKSYIRFYERKSADQKWVAVSLDIAAVA